MNGLLEILTTKEWMIMPEYVHGSRAMWEQNLNGHIAVEYKAKKLPYGMVMTDGAPAIKSYQVTETGTALPRYSDGMNVLASMKVPFVNIMPVEGPITRNGGACTYGSKDLRDWIMEAANNDFCKGHVFVINTPGGSAWSINDFKQGIEYAHEHNQKVYAFIDGLCASAGMYLASQCDEVYYMHPKDMIGSIGVFGAFYTEKDGSYNKFSNETYHEIYDPESYDKNKWYRDIADDPENNKDLLEELKQDGIAFRNDIKKSFPAATDEHIHGKMFEAEKVKGILCDGQLTLGGVVSRAFEVANGKATPVERVAPISPADDVPEVDPAPAAEGTASASGPENLSNHNIDLDMKQYEKIAAACGVEEFVVTEEGAHFVPQMLDALDQTLEQHQTEKANADEQVKNLQAQVENAEKERNEAVANKEKELNDAHEQAINDLNTQHQEEVNNLNQTHEEALNAEKEAKANIEKELNEAKEALATAQEQIKDRDEKIAALSGAPGEEHQGSPANNGTGAEGQQIEGGMPAYDHSKSPLENARIRKEYMAKINK